MKICRHILMAVSSIMLLAACDNSKEDWTPNNNGSGDGKDPVTEEKVVWHKRAKETYDAIVRCYRITSGTAAGLFNENYPKGSGDGAASFLWPYDGLVAGVSTLHKLGYEVGYKDMVDRFEAYYRQRGVLNVGGLRLVHRRKERWRR